MDFDVIVIGAGPAGATAAKVLAEKGISVVLIDKQTFPRDKPCGGGLSVKALARYPYLEKHQLIDSYSYNCCIHTSSLKHVVNIMKNKPIWAMVLRKKFDAGLVTIAAASGAVVQSGKKVVQLKTNVEQAEITLHDGSSIKASFVIASDGMWSTMTKQVGEPQNIQNTGICVVGEIPVKNQIINQWFSEKHCVHIHKNIFGIPGYGWVFPKQEHLNIGIGVFRHVITSNHEKNLRTLYAQYFHLLKETNILPKEINIGPINGGVFPTLPMQRTYRTRIVFCGDAGGLTNPLTGEGIYYAMLSGEIASKIIANALTNSVFDERALSIYQHEWIHEFGNMHKLRRFSSMVLYRLYPF